MHEINFMISTHWYDWCFQQAELHNLLLGQGQELQLLLLAFFNALLDDVTGEELKRREGVADLHGVNAAPP